MATEGFGARLLAHQDEDGLWAGGAFFPGDAELIGDAPGQAVGRDDLVVDHAFGNGGVGREALAGTAEKLEQNARWEYDDLPYWDGEIDTCINAATLANGAWLGADVTKIRDFMLDHRSTDDGWMC